MNIAADSQAVRLRLSGELAIPAIRRQIVEGFVKGQNPNTAHDTFRRHHDQEGLGLRPDVMDIDMSVAKELISVPCGVQNHELGLIVVLGDPNDFCEIILEQDPRIPVDPRRLRKGFAQRLVLAGEDLRMQSRRCERDCERNRDPNGRDSNAGTPHPRSEYEPGAAIKLPYLRLHSARIHTQPWPALRWRDVRRAGRSGGSQP